MNLFFSNIAADLTAVVRLAARTMDIVKDENVSGDVDEAEITPKERAAGIKIEDLIIAVQEKRNENHD